MKAWKKSLIYSPIYLLWRTRPLSFFRCFYILFLLPCHILGFGHRWLKGGKKKEGRQIWGVRLDALRRLLAESLQEGRKLGNPRGPVNWAAPLHRVKPVEPGKDAAQESPGGQGEEGRQKRKQQQQKKKKQKQGKADCRESQRKDTRNTERITSVRWPGSGPWLHKEAAAASSLWDETLSNSHSLSCSEGNIRRVLWAEAVPTSGAINGRMHGWMVQNRGRRCRLRGRARLPVHLSTTRSLYWRVLESDWEWTEHTATACTSISNYGNVLAFNILGGEKK